MPRTRPLIWAALGAVGLIAAFAIPQPEEPSAAPTCRGNGHQRDAGSRPTPAYCGNGLVDPGEACDDGNTASGDGCSSDCHSLETCGNGIVDVAAGEECDDGNSANDDACLSTCRLGRCGDGFVHAGVEACDSGGVNSATCNFNCTFPSCGDSILNPASGEQCEDGNSVDGDGCSSSCIQDCPATP